MFPENFPFQQAVIIGGTGMVGHRVVQELLQVHPKLKIFSSSRAVENGRPAGPLAPTVLQEVEQWGSRVHWFALDLEAEPHFLQAQLVALQKSLENALPTVLVLAAAFTNVDGCEVDQDKCHRVNERNTLQVLQWGQQQGAFLVFYSTDYVFDGAEGPYGEDHPRHAESRYGQAKVYVEEWCETQAMKHSLIVRTTGVYDYVIGSKNFLMQLLEAAPAKRPFRVPHDQWANPLWSRELAQATIELLTRKETGIYHVAGGQYMPRIEFARLICRVFGFDEGFLVPVATKDLNQKAKRPLKGGLKCLKLQQTLGWAPQAPEPVLKRMREWNQLA